LLGNAWKFTSKAPTARIEFGTTEKDGLAAFFVRDNGAGFDMAYASKLFAPFPRLHTSEEFPGTGIGLATVQRIVQRHGGRIWAEGVVDGGATFRFAFPARSSGSMACIK
jgi:light-regulated signal transduction histidine kinase (bacteriophytochrome)